MLRDRPSGLAFQRNNSAQFPYATAFNRIGPSVVDHLAWLVEFARRDLRRTTNDHLREIRDEVLAFIALSFPRTVVGQAELPASSIVRTLVAAGPTFSEDELNRALPHDTVQDLQALAQRALHEYRSEGATLLPAITVHRGIQRQEGGGTLYTIPGAAQQHPATVSFVEQLAVTLQKEGWRLQVCQMAGCGTVFVQRRYGQQFCSNTCRSRLAMQRKRARDKDLRDTRDEMPTNRRTSMRAASKGSRKKGRSRHGAKGR